MENLTRNVTGSIASYSVPKQYLSVTVNPLSVDAKKSELIGPFKNAGARYCRKTDEVNTYDFPSEAKCKAIPYGLYDGQGNRAMVFVGTRAGTPQFAVGAICHWWEHTGKAAYPKADHLMIEANSDGGNGH